MGKITLMLIAGAILAIGWTLNGLPQSESQAGETDSVPTISADRIVSQLRPVQELASLKVGVSGIVRATQPGTRFWQGESSMVMLVRGRAIYSVDVSSIHVAVNCDEVVITLDRPRISDYWVDVKHTQIWDRQTGRFRSPENPELEATCWASAKSLILQAANVEHHRQLAQSHAEHTIIALLRDATGRSVVQRVQVRWRGGPRSASPKKSMGRRLLLAKSAARLKVQVM